MDATPSGRSHHREPWNKGKLTGQKAPFKPKDIWVIGAEVAPLFGGTIRLRDGGLGRVPMAGRGLPG